MTNKEIIEGLETIQNENLSFWADQNCTEVGYIQPAYDIISAAISTLKEREWVEIDDPIVEEWKREGRRIIVAANGFDEGIGMVSWGR